MRISKSNKTSVKASTDNKALTKTEVEKLWDTKALYIDFGDSDAMCQDNGYTLDQILKYMDQGYNVYIDEDTTSVKACGDVKASTQSNVIYSKDGIVVKKTGRDYDFIATIQNNTDDIFYINTYDPNCDNVEECNVVVNPHDWIGILADDEGYDIVEYFEKLGGVTASKKLSTTDKALQHIKAAIDILGKSGNKDAVTKDSIANLATVMFDIKASTITATSKCKYSKKECIDAIQDQYGKNKKEAEEYYKSADAKTLEALVDGFNGNAKKAFLDD